MGHEPCQRRKIVHARNLRRLGGPIPLGYRLGDRKLEIEPDEAEIVRGLFDRYVELKSTTILVDELATNDVRTKVRSFANGRTVGGVHFGRGSLSQLLRNPIYSGRVHHRGELYDGEHQAIITVDQWDKVQRIMAGNRYERKVGTRVRYPSLLTSMISDPDGRAMTPVSTHKDGYRHHYYVTRLKPGEDPQSAWRVASREIDRAALDAFRSWLNSTEREAEPSQFINDRELAEELGTMAIPQQRALLLEREVSVQLLTDALRLSIGGASQTEDITLPARLVHRGFEKKLVLENGSEAREPDPVLVKLVAQAMSARQALASSDIDPLTNHYSKRHLWQLLRISFLAPDIIAAIVEGRQPPSLTGRRLLRVTDLPLDWSDQRKLLGFA